MGDEGGRPRKIVQGHHGLQVPSYSVLPPVEWVVCPECGARVVPPPSPLYERGYHDSDCELPETD